MHTNHVDAQLHMVHKHEHTHRDWNVLCSSTVVDFFFFFLLVIQEWLQQSFYGISGGNASTVGRIALGTEPEDTQTCTHTSSCP